MRLSSEKSGRRQRKWRGKRTDREEKGLIRETETNEATASCTIGRKKRRNSFQTTELLPRCKLKGLIVRRKSLKWGKKLEVRRKSHGAREANN